MNFSVEEIGHLNFGLELCKAINKLYPTSWKPVVKENKFRIVHLNGTVLLIYYQTYSFHQRKDINLKSFMGPNGMPFFGTIQCLVDTDNSRKYLMARMNHVESFCSNSDIGNEMASSIYPYASTNECLVEHSFGFTTKKGQGHLQTMEEYIHAKSKHALDFQMIMINSPFNQ